MVRLEWAGSPGRSGGQVLLSALPSKVQEYKNQFRISPNSSCVRLRDSTETTVCLSSVFASILQLSKGISVCVHVCVCVCVCVYVCMRACVRVWLCPPPSMNDAIHHVMQGVGVGLGKN